MINVNILQKFVKFFIITQNNLFTFVIIHTNLTFSPMKKAILSFLAFIVILSASAQTKTDKASVKWGNEFAMGKKMILEKVISATNDQILLLIAEYKGMLGGQKSYHTCAIKNDLNFAPVKELILKTSDKELQFLNIFELNSTIHVFSVLNDKKAKTKTLYLHSLNKQTLIASSGEKITTLDYDEGSRRNSGGFEVILSEDGSKILVFYYTPLIKDEPETFGAIVFDNNMEVLWENIYSLPYNDEFFTLNEIFLGNNGQLFLTGKKYSVKKYGSPDPKNYNIILLSSSEDGDELLENPIVLNDYYISDITAKMLPNNDIVCSGFTTSKSKSWSVNGVFYILIDHKTREIELTSTKPFEYEFIKEGMTEKQEKKTDKQKAKGKDIELPNFIFKDFIVKENGGALVVAEQYYVIVTSYTDSKGNTHTTYHYYYNDIIAISINPSGEIEWASKIQKYQHSTNDGGFYSSYAMAVIDDKAYFVFNDHIENILSPTNSPRNAYTGKKKSVVALCELNSSGEVTRELVFPTSEVELMLIPKLCEQISADELFVYCRRIKKNKFGILKFN